MKIFDPINTLLKGTNLIEASAGTGKTYTIAGIFLRLIIEERLAVDQILVVTFTKAATEELKERIRNKLLTAKSAFLNEGGNDDFMDALVKNMTIRLWPFNGFRMPSSILIMLPFLPYTVFAKGFCMRMLLKLRVCSTQNL